MPFYTLNQILRHPCRTYTVAYKKSRWQPRSNSRYFVRHWNAAPNEMHIFVNHWPTRGEGEELSRPKRIQAAIQLRKRIDGLIEKDAEARIVVMGDFNDDPNSDSVKQYLVKNDLYNPMVFLLTQYAGSLSHKLHWFLFDQIILSNNWMKSHDNAVVYDKAAIYAPESLKEVDGKFAGTPFRTYAGDHYLGGPSDHCPVYLIFNMDSR